MKGLVAAFVVLIGAALLVAGIRARRQKRSKRQITRTCVTCDNLGTSELCKPCNGSAEHWVERPRTHVKLGSE